MVDINSNLRKNKLYMSMSDEDKEIIYSYFQDIIEDLHVLKLDEYKQHFNVSRLQHSINVACLAYKRCKKYNVDTKSAVRGALLHDFFLYDWRKEKHPGVLHGPNHPKVALRQALKRFDLNHIERDVILKHMWPVSLAPYKYIESFIVSNADKCAAIIESYQHFDDIYKKKMLRRKALSNARKRRKNMAVSKKHRAN